MHSGIKNSLTQNNSPFWDFILLKLLIAKVGLFVLSIKKNKNLKRLYVLKIIKRLFMPKCSNLQIFMTVQMKIIEKKDYYYLIRCVKNFEQHFKKRGLKTPPPNYPQKNPS